jgi:streptogramin lyase
VTTTARTTPVRVQAGGWPEHRSASPWGGDGAVYVAESTANRVTVIDDGTASTVAGGDSDASDYGDGEPATSATLNSHGIAVAPDGELYIADLYHSVVRGVTETGTITRFAGTYEAGFSGDGGPASRAQLHEPRGVAVGPDGSTYIADSAENRVRRVDADGTITTVAGTGEAGFSGDGGPATEASFSYPTGIAVAPDGILYIADTDNNRIRRIAD